MGKYDGYVKGFHQISKAWYGGAILGTSPGKDIDQIYIGFFSESGLTAGELVIRWASVGGRHVPLLGAFDDAWGVLAQMPELIQMMAEIDGKNVSPDEFAARLVAIGFKDLTQTKKG